MTTSKGRWHAGGLASTGRPENVTAVLAVAAAWIVFSLMPARVVLPVFLQDPNYSHGLLFPVVALVLTWRTWPQLAAAGDGARWPGILLLVAGTGLASLGHWVHTALQLGWRGYVFLQAAGWLAATAGWMGILLGWPRFCILAPRLGFMVFVIPLPDTWLLTWMLALQRMVAVCSTGLLRAMGVVVCREGDLLHLPTISLGVAGACSGIRSLMAFFATAAVCAVFLNLKATRALLLLALAPMVAVGTNILRVIVTSLLAMHWGQIWLEGPLHDAMGLGVVLLGGYFLFAIAQAMRPTGSPSKNSPANQEPRRFHLGVFRTAAFISAAILLAAALGMNHVSRHYARMAQSLQIQPVDRRPLAEFPRHIGSWQTSGEFQLAPFEQDMLRPSDHLIRTYADSDGNQLRVTVLYWDPRPRNPGVTAPPPVPHSPNLCWRYEGWDLIRSEKLASQEWMPDARIETSFFEKPGQERLVLYWRSTESVHSGRLSFAHLWSLMGTLFRSWREAPDAWGKPLYQVRIDSDPAADPSTAKVRASGFARQMADRLPEFGIGQQTGLVRLSRPSQSVVQLPVSP